jgi:hypothetical protein
MKETPSIPDNSSEPKLASLHDYFEYRRRIQRISNFYRKTSLSIPDEQGLPNVRREILRRSH